MRDFGVVVIMLVYTVSKPGLRPKAIHYYLHISSPSPGHDRKLPRMMMTSALFSHNKIMECCRKTIHVESGTVTYIYHDISTVYISLVQAEVQFQESA